MSRKKLIGREVWNSGIDGGLFQGPDPESLGIILPDQRQFRGLGSFNLQKMWYLQSQTVCDKFLFLRSFRLDQSRVQAPSYPTTRSFFVKYYSIAFAILPGVARGVVSFGMILIRDELQI